MKNHTLKNIILFLVLAFTLNSCTETYILQTNTYEEAIVIEATLTNEIKKQEIKITKTAKFEDDGIQSESGAKVIVKDNLNNQYIFEENSGKYISQTEFQVVADREYTLEITTTDGKIYQSTPVVLTTVNPIQDVVAKVTTNKDNETGVEINVSSYDPAGTSKYYRYEYEETYKIVAPRWASREAIITGAESVELIPNDPNTRICYSTKNSTDIILVNTNNQTEDRVNLPIRFIEEDNYIIGHRYSILVKQYIENREAYTFHKTMKDISSSSSILSPKQPGVLAGNIKCISDPNTKVIGYFDVSTVSSQRIFFNYSDLFPGKKPPYFNTCEDISFVFCFEVPPCSGDSMLFNIAQHTMTYFANGGINYTFVPVECGDCTSFSSNVIPSFWTN